MKRKKAKELLIRQGYCPIHLTKNVKGRHLSYFIPRYSECLACQTEDNAMRDRDISQAIDLLKGTDVPNNL